MANPLEGFSDEFVEFLARVGGQPNEVKREISNSMMHAGKKKLKKATAFSAAQGTTIVEDLGIKIKIDWQPPSEACPPSERLESILKDIKMYWGLNSEKAKRTVVDMLLLDVLVVKKCCKVWCEVPMRTDKVYGNVDYAVTKWTEIDMPTKPYVVVLEGKKQWVNEDQYQLMAEMYACLKVNGDGKSIHGVLTNEVNWRFFKLEADLTMYCSDLYFRPLQLHEILGIISAMFSAGASE